MNFLNDQKILYKKQHGFQNNVFMADTIISLIGSIEKAINNNLIVCRIFVDLQKAFNTIDHNILLG